MEFPFLMSTTLIMFTIYVTHARILHENLKQMDLDLTVSLQKTCETWPISDTPERLSFSSGLSVYCRLPPLHLNKHQPAHDPSTALHQLLKKVSDACEGEQPC